MNRTYANDPKVSKRGQRPLEVASSSGSQPARTEHDGVMTPVDRAVFRLPGSALFVPILLFFVVTPLASASVWTVWLYIVPVLAMVYVFWTRTVADLHAITVYDHRGKRRIPWADLDGFEFHGPRWALAVTLGGRKIRLPMVRPRDLPRLAEVSGGRLYLGETAVEDAEAASNNETAIIETRTTPEGPSRS